MSAAVAFTVVRRAAMGTLLTTAFTVTSNSTSVVSALVNVPKFTSIREPFPDTTTWLAAKLDHDPWDDVSAGPPAETPATPTMDTTAVSGSVAVSTAAVS